jgi:hypothetical protein
MNPDPETLFVLRVTEPPTPIRAVDATCAVQTQEAGPGQMPSETIVGEPFFWASGSVVANLS